MNWVVFPIRTVFALFIFSISFAVTLEIDYTSCKNIQEIIKLETDLILKNKKNDIDSLANLHISRGETYLLNGQIEDAINDFYIVYMFLDKIKNNKIIKFRLLFNEILWNVMLDKKNEVEILGEHLICIFDEICFQKNFGNQHTTLSTERTPIFFCKKTNIVGPDQEPYSGWCKEVVISTGVALAQLISVLPKNAAKIALGSIIAILEQKALDCCEAGGLWKACVGPLAEKFNNWNQKWKVLRVPPDPAFD